MTKLKFEGLDHVRSFTKADFERHGVEDQGAVKFDEDNNWVAEVSTSAAEFLVEQERGFREATQDDEDYLDETRVPSGYETAVMPSIPEAQSTPSPEAVKKAAKRLQKAAKGGSQVQSTGQDTAGAASGGAGTAGTRTGGRSTRSSS